MMHSRFARTLAAWTAPLVLAPALLTSAGFAHETGQRHVHFQKPNLKPAPKTPLSFRSGADDSADPQQDDDAPEVRVARKPAKPLKQPTSSQRNDVRAAFAAPDRSQRQRQSASRVEHRDAQIEPAAHEPVLIDSRVSYDPVVSSVYCDHCDGGCTCEPGCGICEVGCGFPEPACGLAGTICDCGEPSCGICGPTCGIPEPGCGFVEPGCACGDPTCGVPDCGSCVDTGPDYWCFPVCLPRMKDCRFWLGVHGFKGPRDIVDGGPGDGNFGFQQGFNFGGRIPLVGRVLPQFSYQLGYQAMQSRLAGTSDGSSADRPQQFFTLGVFRRVPSGLQFGVVWDALRDELHYSQDFQQVRYQLSLASPHGREFGFRGTSATKNGRMSDSEFQAVDQYTLFFGRQFRRGGYGRFWGGGTNDSEGILGAEFDVPINDSFSVYSTFNYLITEKESGRVGAQEESWNVGFNLVWHLGRRARQGRYNTHRSMFEVADNGSMFIDLKP